LTSSMKKPASNKPSSIGRLIRLIISSSKWTLLTVAVLIVVNTLCTLSLTLFIKVLIDDYIIPLTLEAVPDFSPLGLALIKLSGVLIVGLGASLAYNLMMVYVEQKVMKKIRVDLFEHMQTLPLRYFDSRPNGDIMSVYTNDVETLRQIIGRTLPSLFSAVISIVSTLVSMIVMSFPLTVLGVAWTFLIFYITILMGKRSKTYFGQRQKNLATVNGYIEEMVSGQRVVKVFCHEDKAIEDFEKINEELRASENNANRIANYIMPVNIQMSNLGYVLLAVVGGAISILSKEGVLTIGALVSFLTLFKNFTRPVTELSQEVNSIVMASAGTDRVYDLMDQESEKDKGYVTLVNVSVKDGGLVESDSHTGKWAWKDADKLIPLEGEVSLKDVDFGYVPEKQVLYDISLTAYPGQKVAFVGGTGAGKTTITNLINRFYDIQDGVITYDGIDVSKINKSSLRKSLGIVLQETHLFSGTILENIRYGRLDATDQECKDAAKLVHADSFIRRLPDGYNTVISADGDNLSQGERQLLSIARTAVANPPVLILDEATSSIDTRTEKLIQRSMDSIMKGRTTLVIAHRLSTVRNADYIVVLDHGKIIETGKHDELLAQKGKYYELSVGSK